MKAYSKEIFRTIGDEHRRFLALLVISALGVLMSTGLKASCNDTRISADEYYKSQRLRDFYIQSTLGLTDDDVKALASVDGVDSAVGFYEETSYYSSEETRYSVLMTTYSETADIPYILDGSAPVDTDDIAVTEQFANKFGISVGDELCIELDDDSSIQIDDFTVCAVVMNVTDVNTAEGCTSFRSTATTDFVAYIDASAVDSEIYTGIALTLDESASFNTYSDEYKDLILRESDKIGSVKSVRENERTQQIKDDALKEIAETEDEANKEFAKAEKELNDAKKELDDAKKQLDESQKMIDMGYPLPKEIIAKTEAGWKSYKEGLAEYESGKAEFESKKADAEEKFEEARAEVNDIEPARWHITTRENLGGYMNISSDMDAIDSLSWLFAIVFLIVAVLVSLITINRMIEENRGLIGTYQALGYTDGEIMRKYLIYGLGAGTLGCILGDFLGYVVLPKFLFGVFDTMYLLPEFNLCVDPVRACVAPLVFLVSILITIAATCSKAFLTMPAELMRPKAPKPGSKVFLERITFIWNRFSFLNKVTARNIFRYKKRLFMTILGILGCTALLVTGFGIKDSVDNLTIRQYDEIVEYDILSVTADEDLDDYIKESESSGGDHIKLLMSPVTLKNFEDQTIQTQIYVFDDDDDPTDFIAITDIVNGSSVKLENDEMYVTRNAGVILDFDKGDSVTVIDSNFVQSKIEVGALIDNYLGNMVYMNRTTYEKHFGEYKPNALMIKTDDPQTLAESDLVRTSVVTDTLRKEFKSGFMVINMVLYLLIVLSAALAFVVLFTLSSTNISERERELATIKVLGFYDREVHFYINKEVTILTVTAILLGLPIGSVLCGFLTEALKMPSLYFQVQIEPISYFYSFAITLLFALFVDLIMNRTLDRIDPAEALKSIE